MENQENHENITLVKDTIDNTDIDALIQWLKTYPRLTQGPAVLQFEEKWSKWIGCKYSVFVNSGSSANLIMLAALLELYKLRNKLVVVPSLGWATDLAPVMQLGFNPVLVDIDPANLAVDIEHLECIFKEQKPSAMLLVSVLGLSPRMGEIVDLCKKYGVILLEDNCLLPGEEIITTDGIKSVENIKVGDMVYTHKNRFKKVLNLMSREYNGEYFELSSYGYAKKLSVTSEHPIYCVNSEDITKKRDKKWTSASEIKNGDYVVFPRYKDIKDVEFIDLSEFDYESNNKRYKKTFEDRKINSLQMSHDLLNIIGWFLSEGGIYRQHIFFTLGKNEKKNVSELLESIQNLNLHHKIKETKTTFVIEIFSKQLKEFFYKNFGNGAKNKRIPQWVLDLPLEKIKILLESYIKGDGCKVKDRENSYSCTSISINLMVGIKMICSKLGYTCGISINNECSISTILGRQVNINKKYQLRFNKSGNDKFNNQKKIFIDEDYIYYKIKNIECKKYKGKVYNFEVEDDNSYCTPCLSLHNCESQGTMYNGIKLGNFGLMSSFSTYFGHTMSTIEGGMICTDDKDVYNMLKQLRSHGWDRDLDSKKQEELREEWGVDNFSALYTFYVPGFNVRATDLQAVLGMGQLEKVDEMISKRNENFKLFKEKLSPYTWFPQEVEGSFTASFCIPIIASSPEEKKDIVKALMEKNVECRPLICGSMGTQPFYIKKYGRKELPNVKKIDECGLYIPNHPKLTIEEIDRMCNCIINVVTYNGETYGVDE